MPSMVRSPVYFFIVSLPARALLQRSRALLGDFRKHPHREDREHAEEGNGVARPGLAEMHHEGIGASGGQKPGQRQHEFHAKRHPLLPVIPYAYAPTRTSAASAAIMTQPASTRPARPSRKR